MSKRYSGKSFKDSSVMKKPKLTFKEKRKLKEKKKRKDEKAFRDLGSGFVVVKLLDIKNLKCLLLYIANLSLAHYLAIIRHKLLC